MQRSIGRKLDTAHRVYALSLAHQAQIAGLVEAVQLMGERLARADALASEQQAGINATEALVARKEETRRIIEEDHLVHLVRIARVALPQDRELHSRFKMPQRRINLQKFVASVRAILFEAGRRKELFVREGMPESFVEDLEGLLTTYVEAVDELSTGAATKVGAGAELKTVTKELMQLIRRLDGINRKRWQKEPQLLAAWMSAKDVTWPHSTPAPVVQAPAPAPAPGPASGSAGSGDGQEEHGAAA